jgi:hypothetical protein
MASMKAPASAAMPFDGRRLAGLHSAPCNRSVTQGPWRLFDWL